MSTATHPSEGEDSLIHYQQIFDESPAPKYIFDLDTLAFLAVNDAALAQYGYTRDEFLSMKVTDLVPGDEAETAAFRKLLSNQPGINYSDFGRARHKRKNGQVFFVHLYAHTTGFNGKNARFAMAIDIDKKVEAEQALREKTAEITDILESVTDGFFAVNARWEVTFMNTEAEHMLRCRREELLGKNLWGFFPEAVGSRFYNEYHRVMAERIAVYFEEYYPPLDIWVSVRAYPSRDGLVIYFIDITDQQRSREKIERDEQNLRAIINNTTDIIWSIDRKYKIISANEPFYQRMELITGKRIDRISHGDFPQENQLKWIEYYERGFSGEAFKTIWRETLEGKDLYEEISLTPIIDSDGQILGVSCISRDVTEHYLYMRRIEEQNDQLRKIAWIQSHEVRAPLTDIMGLVSLVNGGILSAEESRNIISLIGQAAGQLDSVVAKTVKEAHGQ